MFRVSPCYRPFLRQALRPDLRFCQREFSQLTTKLKPSGNGSVTCTGFSALRRTKIGYTLWREYRAVCAMLQRSGFLGSNSEFTRILASNQSRSLHTSTSRAQDEKNDQNKGNKKDNNNFLFFLKTTTYIMLLSLVMTMFLTDNRAVSQISWQEFVHQMLSKGEVQQIIVLWDVGIANVIVHENAVLNGRPVRNRVFTMQIPDVDKFEEKLREVEQQLGITPANGVPVVFERQKDSVWPSLAATLFIGFMLLNAVAAVKSMKNMSFFNQSITKAKYILVDPRLKQGVGTKFADIAGLKEAKQEVMEFVDYLRKSDHYRRLGAKVPKGSLLLGPPGCGKTLLAKAVATEANVPFLSMNGSEFIEMVGGLGASRVRDLFKAARRMAPCIVYIDEIDAIGSKRGGRGGGNDEKIQTLLQLLIEMDGMTSNKNQDVIMLASTNRAEVLDEALLRPGRFDRRILIGLPTLIERKEIFEVYLNKLRLENPASHYSGRLAQLTPNYSGADIANICNEAALHAAGKKQDKVTAVDLEYAVSRVKYGREKEERTICDDERKQIAFYLAGQTIVGWMLKNTDALMKVSIIQYTSGVGSLQHFRPSSFLTFKEELCDRMAMYLGGRAAESMVFHQNSTQAESDLKKVSNVAYNMITSYGMNDAVGEVSFPPLEDFQRRFYSRKLHGTIDFEARKLITECFSNAEQILRDNADNLDKLAEALLKKETLSYDDICNIIGTPPHGHKNLVDIIDFGPEASTPNSNASEASPAKEDSSSK